MNTFVIFITQLRNIKKINLFISLWMYVRVFLYYSIVVTNRHGQFWWFSRQSIWPNLVHTIKHMTIIKIQHRDNQSPFCQNEQKIDNLCLMGYCWIDIQKWLVGSFKKQLRIFFFFLLFRILLFTQLFWNL